MIFHQISALPKGIQIQPNYRVKGLGVSRGESALVYLVPNNRGGKDSEKRIRKAEWERAHKQLLVAGVLTRTWFVANIPDTAKDGPCAFRFAGEVFVLLGLAQRVNEARGSKYVSVAASTRF